ncbi:Outer membrane lipoprotein Omp16 [Thalassocella blandensis]|nr:Outer membrane lipoprotein Omp16 [Thalassocella blandensis]
MIKSIKLFLSLFAIVGFLAACSSNPEVEPTPTPVPTPVPTPTPEVVEDPLEGVSSVFYFEFDSAILTSEARSALSVHAEVLKDEPRSIRLEGHADERGSREYNMALGERRANAARDYLVLQGVDSSLIETISYGEEQPAAFGSYESAWSQNRRVELK